MYIFLMHFNLVAHFKGKQVFRLQKLPQTTQLWRLECSQKSIPKVKHIVRNALLVRHSDSISEKEGNGWWG